MFRFLEGLDRDIQSSLLNQLRDLWTHTSTALEGNTLTLGDTHFVLEDGLTISGKPLKDHQEVVGRARAIDLIYGMVDRPITQEDIFALHKAVQTEQVSDMYKPMGAWKVEPNGTYVVDENESQIYIEYAPPKSVAPLMKEVTEYINSQMVDGVSVGQAPKVYARVHMGVAHIHPFWDGNGRIARLLANIALLNSGLPPIVINRESRREYIAVLSRYQRKTGVVTAKTGVWPTTEHLTEFEVFSAQQYKQPQKLIDNAFLLQRGRAQGELEE